MCVGCFDGDGRGPWPRVVKGDAGCSLTPAVPLASHIGPVRSGYLPPLGLRYLPKEVRKPPDPILRNKIARKFLMTTAPRSSARSRRTSSPKPLSKLGRLRTYRIENLFENFTYDFDLDSNGPTLLTGVNGTGKSTILRTIDAVSTCRWTTLAQVPFTSLALGFDTDRVLKVDRLEGGFNISLTGESSWKFTLVPEYEADRRLFIDLQREYAALRALEEEAPMSEHDLDEIRREAVERRLAAEHYRTRQSPAPEWAAKLAELFPVLFITDQRLIIESPGRASGRERSTRAAADDVARQIVREMSAATSAYGNRSQALDHDFPQRVIGTIKNPPSVSDEDLRQQLDELTRRSESLEAVGLLAKESVGEFEDLDLALANVKPLIQTYVADSRQKLEVLEPLRIKLQLFSEFLRQHYTKKRIVFDPKDGFTIRTSQRSSTPLPPSKLSSGEQQMMVLAYQILFKATPGTLVLIDEPELSLHVLWQSTFVEDLAQMGKVNNLSFLLATHSPSLIGGRNDLKRSLDQMSRI